ncbi:MAG: RnfH family protein [Pseudomonadota bacterium]
MQVEVVFARTHEQWCHQLQLPEGATVAQAQREIIARGLFSEAGNLRFDNGFDNDAHQVGVFGEICDGQRILRDGDRLEIYRPLEMDAKSARRRRAQSETLPQSKSSPSK